MIEKPKTLPSTIEGRPIYRRDFTKSDGRNLFLYGFNPHELQALPEEAGDVAKGGELRFHPLRGEWNLYAPHRQNRTFQPSQADDPLAPSVLDASPTEIPFEDFELAVFENKFTSLHAEAPIPPSIGSTKTRQAKGHCDVVVYSPKAKGNLHSIGQSQRRLLLEAWNDRYDALFAAGHKYVAPFENRGDEVGVTLHHPHGQIYAFPFIPRVQKSAATAFEEGFDLAANIAETAADYGVASVGGISAYCPPFARFPYEVWIAPQIRRAGPWEFNETEKDGFAHLLGDITRRYDELFQRPTPYMMTLHAAPLGHQSKFHFSAQFYPLLRAADRVKYLASVEQSTGVFTVDVMPEMAAETLRAL